MLGRDDGALDDEHVEPRLQHALVVRPHTLGRQRRGRQHAGVLDVADAPRHQLVGERGRVDLLHAPRGGLPRQLRYLREQRIRVLVAAPQALEVQHADAAEPPQLDRRRRRHHPVHGRGQERQLDQVGPQLPADVDVLSVARAAGRHDRDVVESVGTPGLLAPPDLDLHCLLSPPEGMSSSRAKDIDPPGRAPPPGFPSQASYAVPAGATSCTRALLAKRAASRGSNTAAGRLRALAVPQPTPWRSASSGALPRARLVR